ncbi:Dual specificity protein phosphatase 23 [Phytophthora pseudosyringae]|uniref:Dual specificity protein phosphatase 23 n=1 Tax=Phytophthora pseudosyringae TaxID=221518 RepID=A0A8T1VN23_9STRA|nr:Dual specificity protein phosphatase 23 [Phytophthora pseudosyringae]
MVFRFSEDYDKELIREVIKQKPFAAKYGEAGAVWVQVAEQVSSAIKGVSTLDVDLTEKQVQDRVRLLKKNWRAGELSIHVNGYCIIWKVAFSVSDGALVMVSHDHNYIRSQRSQRQTPTTSATMGDQDRVLRYRGCVALRFAPDSAVRQEIRAMLGLDSATKQQPRFAVLPEGEWHLTLVTKDELRGLSAAAVQEALNSVSTRCFAIGLGGGGGATRDLNPNGEYFVVCVWPKAQAFRTKLGLPLKDFHVSVSTANSHDIDKTSDALLDDSCLAMLDKAALGALSRQVMLEHKPERALNIAALLCTQFGEKTTRGWVRLADAALLADLPKLAMLSYGYLIGRMITRSIEDGGERRGSALWRHCCAQLSKCAELTEWGPVFVDGELDQVPPDLRSFLCKSWSISTWIAIRENTRNTSTSLSYPSRERLTTPYSPMGGILEQYTLPRFFRWIVPFQLAAMSTPRTRGDIRCLCYSLHVQHVVTLTEEEPLPAAWFEGLPHIKNTFLPVANYKAPSIPQIDMFVRLCCNSSAAGVPVLVHCGGGKGRAGTMVACYLVAFGFNPPPPELYRIDGGASSERWFQPAMTAAEAMQALRAMRPGSIETKEQEEAVSQYCSHLWKRRGVLPLDPAQPLPSRPVVTGNPVETTDLLVLCGIPGSGKSSFRRALVKRTAASRAAPSTVRANNELYQPWIEVHSDEIGRKGCERSIGQGSNRRAILDRCNGVAADRKKFLNLAATWSEHATAIVFDIPTKLCEARAMLRADHPTLPPGRRVGFAVRQHSSTFEFPGLSEGFQTIVRITSVEAALKLVDLLSPPLPLLKFPRTPHLIDLGAATSDDLVSNFATISLPDEDTTIVLTEKVDGANMGFSLSPDGALVVQNRSHSISSETHRQFRDLDSFLNTHRAVLYEILYRDPLFPGRFILYGEWLAATHSIPYSKLGSLFYAFDLYDRETEQFWDRSSLQELLAISADDDKAIQLVPKLWEGRVLPPRDELIAMAQQRRSQFYDGPVEGIYVKWERLGRVKERSKIVRSDFLAGDAHWSQRPEGVRFNSMLKLNTVNHAVCIRMIVAFLHCVNNADPHNHSRAQGRASPSFVMLSRVLRARGALVRASSSALAVSAAPSRSVLARHQLLAASCARWNSSAAVSAAAKKDPEPVAAVSEAAAAASDPTDNVKIDLGTVGAEDAKVLTIADVLNARELELATNKTLFDFEEWESIDGTETVHDAVLTMVERNIGSLIVTEAKEGIVGIVTERDILKKISPRTVMTEEKLVHDVMASHIMCIHPSTTVIDALATMTKENIRHLAVVNGDMTSAVKRGSVQEEDMRCVLSITDIVRAYAEFEASKSTVVAAQEGAADPEAKTKTEADKLKETKPAETTAAATPTTEAAKAEVPEAAADAAATTSSAPVVTAATLLKKKHKHVKLILNTRPEDNVTVAEAVEEMAKRDFGAVLVVDKEQRVLGIFTERDYIRKVLFEVKDPTKLLVTDVMSSVGSVLQIEDPLEKCWDLAATSNCRHFPVIGVMRQDREKELAGILSIKDIVREISKDHHATPGFRLMEFLKSKMEPKRAEPKSDPKAEPAPEPKVEAATESKPEVTSAPTEARDAKVDAPTDATTAPVKEATLVSSESKPKKVEESQSSTTVKL